MSSINFSHIKFVNNYNCERGSVASRAEYPKEDEAEDRSQEFSRGERDLILETGIWERINTNVPASASAAAADVPEEVNQEEEEEVDAADEENLEEEEISDDILERSIVLHEANDETRRARHFAQEELSECTGAKLQHRYAPLAVYDRDERVKQVLSVRLAYGYSQAAALLLLREHLKQKMSQGSGKENRDCNQRLVALRRSYVDTLLDVENDRRSIDRNPNETLVQTTNLFNADFEEVDPSRVPVHPIERSIGLDKVEAKMKEFMKAFPRAKLVAFAGDTSADPDADDVLVFED